MRTLLKIMSLVAIAIVGCLVVRAQNPVTTTFSGGIQAPAANLSPCDIDATTQTGSDIIAQILAAMNGPCAALGGTIRVPAGSYVSTTHFLIPNTGGTFASQKTFRIVGAGAGGLSEGHGPTTPPNGGTIIDMRYNATTGGKIDTRGAGKLEIEGIAFTDTASDGSPFVFISNTVAHFHNNQFYGNCADATKQDVFVLGGTSTISNGSATDPFQGYGTVIRDNQADCIGRFALLQTFANAINIESNHIFISSGNPAQAAIEINPTADPAVGNYIAGNLIEVLGYKYGISLVQNARNNYIGGNSCFDHGTPTVACINVNYAVGNFGNQIIDNNADSAIPPISGVGSALGISVAPNQCGVHGTNGTADICLVGFAPFGNQISIDGGANGTGFGGKITSYNGITTVGNGVASEVAAVDLTARNAAIPLTNLYSVPATGGGMYQVCWVAAVTRSAGTSSVLGGTDGFEIRYIDGDTANTVTSPAAGAPTAGGDRAYSQTNAGNATNSNISGCTVAWVQASTTIQYAMDYTSIGMPAMQYNLHIKVLAM